MSHQTGIQTLHQQVSQILNSYTLVNLTPNQHTAALRKALEYADRAYEVAESSSSSQDDADDLLGQCELVQDEAYDRRRRDDVAETVGDGAPCAPRRRVTFSDEIDTPDAGASSSSSRSPTAIVAASVVGPDPRLVANFPLRECERLMNVVDLGVRIGVMRVVPGSRRKKVQGFEEWQRTVEGVRQKEEFVELCK